MAFTIGDIVTWSSQSRGRRTTKQGEVVAVIPDMGRPDRARFPDLFYGPECGMFRRGESYVVKVGHKHYWPRVKQLALVADEAA